MIRGKLCIYSSYLPACYLNGPALGVGQFVAVVSVGGLRPHPADKAFAVEHGSDVFVGIFLLFCVPVLARS